MKKVIIRSMVVLLLFALTGCGKCEHEYDNGVITKESTCTEEGGKTYTCILCEEVKIESVPIKAHTYTEEITKEPTYTEKGEKIFTCEYCNNSYIEDIPVLDREPYNQNIYEQMVKFYDSEDYISALIIGKNAIGQTDTKRKINEMIKNIFQSQEKYIKEQIQSAIENKDYEVLDILYYYKGLMYHVEFDDVQLAEYKCLRELQGQYRYFESSNDSIQVEINGYNLKIGDEQYILEQPKYHSSKFSEGTIQQIRTGLIAIRYEDGTYIKYQSDAGKEWEEKQKQGEEKRRQKEETAKKEYLANEPQIGMTADEVKASNWGSPQKINKTTYEWGTTEQWCYPNNEYIYFEDGVVTAIQESN